jgi:hypothetical protein
MWLEKSHLIATVRYGQCEQTEPLKECHKRVSFLGMSKKSSRVYAKICALLLKCVLFALLLKWQKIRKKCSANGAHCQQTILNRWWAVDLSTPKLPKMGSNVMQIDPLAQRGVKAGLPDFS